MRHLRIGFNEPLPIGSVLVRGGGALSVLKPDAAYPGDLADDSQWIAAERIVGGKSIAATKSIVEGLGAVDVARGHQNPGAALQPHAHARRSRAGGLAGRRVDQRRARGQRRPASAGAIGDARRRQPQDWSTNRTTATWGAWDNGEHGAAVPISPEHPEIVTLTWPRPVELAGVCLIWAGFSAVEVDAFTGSDQRNHRRGARRQLAARRPAWPTSTRSIRCRSARIGWPSKSRSPPGRCGCGSPARRNSIIRIWRAKVSTAAGCGWAKLMALAPLADGTSLASLVLPKAEAEPPPIPVRFTLPKPGVVTLVIEDEQHKRVRNLVSETPFPAGDNVAWWDGSDDLLRDPQAARHGALSHSRPARRAGQIPSPRPVAQAACRCTTNSASTTPASRPGKRPTAPAVG